MTMKVNDEEISDLVRLLGVKGATMALFDTHQDIESEDEALDIIEDWKARNGMR